MEPRMGVNRGTKLALFLAALVAAMTPGVALAVSTDDTLATSLEFEGISPDGTHAYVETRQQLVRADTDQMVDVYDIDDGVAKLVSIGPDGGNRNGTCLYVAPPDPEYPPYFESCDAEFRGTSGGRVYFRSESLRSSEPSNGLYGYYRDGDSLAHAGGAVAETEDNSVQILQDRDGCLFKRDSSGTTLISTGPAVPGGGCPADGDFHFVSQTPDGVSIFFYSKVPLVAEDADDARDLYRSRDGVTTLISTGPTDDGRPIAHRYGSRKEPFGPVSTADGETAVFTTAASLTAEDVDGGADDIYLRSGSVTTLVSGSGSATADVDARLEGQSDDLGTILFETNEALDPADTNGARDVYRWKNGTISLLAVNPAGQPFAHGSSILDSSSDGTKVFFYAWESPVFSEGEIYERSAGTTTRLSPPGIAYQRWSDWMGASDDGSVAYFESERPLTPDDDDDKVDIFRYENGTLTLVSAGGSSTDPADAENPFAPLNGDPVSDDGSHVYFRSAQSMTPDDTDCGRFDFYEHSDSGNRLVTVGADAPTIVPGPCTFDTKTPTFELEPANPGEGLECRINQGDFEPCSSPFTPEVDGNGDHVLYVRGDSGTDPQSGVADRWFTVDARPPDPPLELELSESGVPRSLRGLASRGVAPVVRCSKACQVDAKVTVRVRSKGRFRKVKFGGAAADSDLDGAMIAVKPSSRAEKVLRKTARARVRIEIAASPSDGVGDGQTLTRVETLRRSK